jgi:hypothetical protein
MYLVVRAMYYKLPSLAIGFVFAVELPVKARGPLPHSASRLALSFHNFLDTTNSLHFGPRTPADRSCVSPACF